MNNANIDYILDIFRTLSGEVPEQMLYREDGDNIELRTTDSMPAMQAEGWSLIGTNMVEAA